MDGRRDGHGTRPRRRGTSARRFAVVLGLLGAAGAVRTPDARADKVADDDAANYLLRTPDRWEFTDISHFADLGVVKAAECKLATLHDASPGTGQGARLMLSVQEVTAKSAPGLPAEYEEWLREWQLLEEQAKQAPEVTEELHKRIGDAYDKLDKAIVALAETPAVRELVMSRWGRNPAAWPSYKVEGETRIGGIPAAKLTVEAVSANLAGNDGPCVAVQFVFVLRKKVTRLAIWRWPTAKDREKLKDDVDMIELSYEVLKAEAIAGKKPPPEPVGAGGGAKDGPAGKAEPVKDLAMGFEVVKPAKFTLKELDRSKEADRNVGFEMKAADGGSDCIVELLVYRVGRAGTTAFSLDDWIKNLGTNFFTSHPAGAVEMIPFPPPSPRNPFLSLPDVSKKKELKRPAPDDLKAGLSKSDVEKLGVIGEVKGAAIGNEKVKEAFRWAMRGNIERVGTDVQAQWTFTYDARTFVLRVTARKEGYEKYKAELVDIFKSLRVLEEPK